MTTITPIAARPVTPLGILTAHLQTAIEQLQHLEDATESVQKALDLAIGLEEYVNACTTRESKDLKAIAEKTQREPWNQRFSDGETVRHLEQEMLSGHVEGQFLKMLVHMTRARRILDIGMFTGYSALAMAEALPIDGVLVACEVDDYVASFAQNLFDQSMHGEKIQIRLAPAIDTLKQLASQGESFDFVFIDADKREYVQYFQLLLDSELLESNGFICVDNTLLQGQPYLSERSTNGSAIAEFNQVVANDSRVEQVLVPLRDGVTLIRRV
ncbi:MAG: class I SAM-dependent methyltransferase [Phormidium tanganyikae FI6-MK23]|jgi:caffeoyl-CoA O-methyltransferase|nr:class I SAM-dependent methyltransferase [Phormidium tanganyikae FI6-MK23]